MKKFLKKNIYRITLSNESRLENLCKFKFSLFSASLWAIFFIILFFAIAFAIFYFSPLKNYFSLQHDSIEFQDTKSETIDNILRLDSLSRRLEENQLYINNIKTILNTNRAPSDSAGTATNTNSLTIDSLMPRSKEEDNFIKKMEEREKYNISILAPLAAESMIFNKISNLATISEASKDSNKAVFIVGSNEPILAIADGFVIDTNYSPRDGGYSVIVQHNKGFLSKYSHLGKLLIKKGDLLEAGQAIALPASNSGRAGHIVNLEMWRNGVTLIPYSVISASIPFKNNNAKDSED